MAKKVSAKNHKKTVTDRRPVPFERIAEMVKAGKSALEIAKKLGRENTGADPSHSLRAILSRMRSIGWRDKSGKLHMLTVARAGGDTPTKTTMLTSKKKASRKQERKKAPSRPEPSEISKTN